MFVGTTFAKLVGDPVGAYIGQDLGWRWTFAFIAGAGALSVLGVAVLVPHTGQSERRSGRGELKAFKKAQVWLALAMTAFGFGAARVIGSAGEDGRTLASAAAVAAFNLGNAAGAYLGTFALETWKTPADASYFGAAMAGTGLAAALFSVALQGRSRLPLPRSSSAA